MGAKGRGAGAARTPRPRAAPPVSRWAVVSVWSLSLAPAVVLPWGLNGYVLPKLTVVAVGVALSLVAGRWWRLERTAFLALVAGLAVLVVAALLGAAPLGQLIGRAPRYEGLVSVGLYAASLGAGAALLGGPGRLRLHLVRATAVSSALAAVLALLQTAGLLTGGSPRPGSLLGNATEQGAYGVVVTSLCVCLLRGRRDPWLLAGVASGLVLVATSASRGALLGLVVSVSVLLVLGSTRVRRVTSVTAAVAVVTSLALPLTRDRLLLLSPLSRQTVEGRWLQWQETLALVAHHPVLGLGPSGFVSAFPGVQTAQDVQTYGTDRLDSPHSLPLQVLVAGGVVLLAVAVAAVVVVVRALLARLRQDDEKVWATAVLASSAGWFTVLCTHFTAPGSTPYVALLTGSALAVPRVRERVVARRALVGVAAVVAGCLALAAAAEVPLRSGLVDLQAGRGSQALGELRAASRLRPWDGDLDANIAHALVVQPPGTPQALEATTEHLARARARYPTDADLLGDAGLAAAQQGRAVQAMRLLDRAHALAPHEPQVLVVRARLRVRAGDVAGALDDLRAAASLTPRDAMTWRLLASVYDQDGQGAPAAEAAARADALGG